jgi:hypothetical protein
MSPPSSSSSSSPPSSPVEDRPPPCVSCAATSTIAAVSVSGYLLRSAWKDWKRLAAAEKGTVVRSAAPLLPFGGGGPVALVRSQVLWGASCGVASSLLSIWCVGRLVQAIRYEREQRRLEAVAERAAAADGGGK